MNTTTLTELIINQRWYVRGADDGQIKSVLHQCLAVSHHVVINFMEHRFAPEGYTAVWLLAESHLALHTFPNFGRSYIELTSCNSEKAQLFATTLRSSSLAIMTDLEVST